MSDILFSPGLSFSKTELALEEMHFFAEKWKLEYFQVEKGNFSGKWSSIHTPRIQIQDSYYSHGFMVNGVAPAQCITLAMIQYDGENTNYRYEPVQTNEFIMLQAGEEVHYLTTYANRAYTIAVEKGFFYDSFNRFFGEPYEYHQHKSRIKIDSKKVDLLDKTFEYWIDSLKQQNTDHQQVFINQFYNEMETEILSSIFETFEIDQNNMRNLQPVSKIIEIENALKESLMTPDSIGSIAERLKISERHMRHLFKNSLQVSPKDYLLFMRLNLIKKELQKCRYGQIRIEDIARKYHYYHMGHFSKEYKKLFGELPSETLKK